VNAGFTFSFFLFPFSLVRSPNGVVGGKIMMKDILDGGRMNGDN
jgi:hypothetical protein